METVQQQSFTAADDATVGYQTLGTGPSLIMVPGVLSTAHMTTEHSRRPSQRISPSIPSNGEDEGGAVPRNLILHRNRAPGRSRSTADYAITLPIWTQLWGPRRVRGSAQQRLIRKNGCLKPGVSIDGSISLTWSAGYLPKTSASMRLSHFRAQPALRWLPRHLAGL
jgi:hypothetical protein